MLLLILFVLFFVVLQDKSLKLTAEELVSSYNSDILMADKKFLNKEIELTGKVSAYYQFTDGENLLELESGNKEIGIYCIIVPRKDNERASQLTKGTRIKLIGICTGMAIQRFPNSVYIKVIEIK